MLVLLPADVPRVSRALTAEPISGEREVAPPRASPPDPLWSMGCMIPPLSNARRMTSEWSDPKLPPLEEGGLPTVNDLKCKKKEVLY